MNEDVNTVSPTLGFIIKTIDYEGYVTGGSSELTSIHPLPLGEHMGADGDIAQSTYLPIAIS